MKRILFILIIILTGISLYACDNSDKNLEVEAVIELIDALPSNITLDDEEKINYVFDKYNLLSKEEKQLVTNYDVLLKKNERLQELKKNNLRMHLVQEVIDLIDALPDVITLDDEEAINVALNKYAVLADEEKEFVTNYNELLDKQAEYDQLLQESIHKYNAQIVIDLIDALPDSIGLSDEKAINNAFEKYNKLEEDAKKYVINYDELLEKYEELENLKEEIDYINTVGAMINSIDKLPNADEVKLGDDLEVLLLYHTYLEYPKEKQEQITNRDKLLELVSIVEDFHKVENVINFINSLPSLNDLTYKDKELVDYAISKYNELKDYSKTLVSNIDVLKKLEEKIVELELLETYKANALVVVNLINKLPSNITVADKELLDECFDAYEKLTDEEKVYVTNYVDLVNKKKQYEEIIANTKYSIKVELDGGYLENMIEIEKTETICEFSVNSYSRDIWSLYTTNIFIYKTSLMKDADMFTSFLKLGISFDSSVNKYVVLQKVPSGTKLELSLRTSEYYILVNPEYSEGYGKVNKIEINNQININTTLPDASTASLNALVTAYSKSEDSDYYIELTGTNTLPIPEKAGYKFVGWYLEKSFATKVTEVSKSTTVYARWEVDKGNITTENILNSVSDVAGSNTLDTLPLENDDAYFTWSSSNNNLYNINGDMGRVSKVYQTHKKQKVTVSVEVKYKAGGSKTLSKEITINTILFNDFSSTPIATYFYTGAVSAYKKYNQRYITDKTLFSETTKEALDIVYYAFIVPSSDGSVSFQNTSYLEEVRALRNHNVRILGCVNGVGTDTSTAFKVITADATLRKKFVNNLMDLVESYNLDGLDLDWEAISSSLKPIASQYNLLCEELRAEMTRRQDEGGSPYLLSMALPASSYGTATDRFDFPTLNKYLDYINIMSYDLNNGEKTTHLSPLYTSTKDNGYGFGAVYGVNRISSLGFDKNKLIIGCAGYGKAYTVSGGSGTYPALGISGKLTKISGYDGSYASGTVYGSVINQLINTGKYTQYTELDSSGRVVGSYLYSATDKIFITYDSKEAVMAKYEYASSIGVGMMCWAYTEDTSDTVIDAIYEAMNK